MTESDFIRRVMVAVFALAMISVAGCASRYTTETKIGGHPVTYRSATDKAVSLKVTNQDMATFAVGQFEFTMNRAQITWGQGKALALPIRWKRVDFIEKDDRIVVQVDGRAYDEIYPAA